MIFYGRSQIDVFHPAKSTGTQIAAINKTGAVINEGDKVWLNKNIKIQGSNYKVTNSSNAYYNDGVLNRAGTFGCNANALYSFGESSAKWISNPFSISPTSVRYCADNSTFVFNSSGNMSVRIDEQNIFQLTSMTPIAEDWFYESNTNSIHKLNMKTGEIIETLGTVPYFDDAAMTRINNTIHSFTGYAYSYAYENGAFVQKNRTIENSSVFYPVAVTLDNKYIVASDQEYYSNRQYYAGGLRLVKVIDEFTFKVLSQSEMPAELQEWYNKDACVVFNQYTGVLTLSSYTANTYAMFKYENDIWVKLNLDLGNIIPRSSLTVSDDLTRAFCRDSSTGYTTIIDLVDLSGYMTVPYRAYNMSENTITGYAANTAGPDEQVKVRTVME